MDPLNPKIKTVLIKTDEVDIGEFTTRTFRPIVQRVSLILDMIDAFSLGKLDRAIMKSEESYDAALEIVKLSTGKEDSWVDGLTLPEMLELLIGIFEVNKDSFLSMKERLQEIGEAVAPKKKQKNSGPRASSSSSKTDTTLKK